MARQNTACLVNRSACARLTIQSIEGTPRRSSPVKVRVLTGAHAAKTLLAFALREKQNSAQSPRRGSAAL